MKIYEDFFDENEAPCKNCVNYNNGEVNENGTSFHEFMCSGYYCLLCSKQSDFSCFEPVIDDK